MYASRYIALLLFRVMQNVKNVKLYYASVGHGKAASFSTVPNRGFDFLAICEKPFNLRYPRAINSL